MAVTKLGNRSKGRQILGGGALAGADGALDVGLAVLLLHNGIGQAHQLRIVAAGGTVLAGWRLLAALALAQVQPACMARSGQNGGPTGHSPMRSHHK